MVLISRVFSKVLRIQQRLISQKYEYEMPETYRNAFYLANASLVEYTNWFVHNALRVVYSDFIEELNNKGLDLHKSIGKINSIMNIIEPCNNFIQIQFPVVMDDGEHKSFTGFRAEHGVHAIKRPSLGGIRLCSTIEKTDIEALALLSTYKYASMGIDMSGAHGGIELHRNELSQEELQRVVKTYTEEMIKKQFCGAAVDIFEPDINCGINEILSIIAVNSKLKGNTGNVCAVGKPHSFGGFINRDKAFAQGVLFGLDVFLQNQNIMQLIGLDTGMKDKTFILQGLGTIGSSTGVYLENAGARCVGIVEPDSNIYIKKGLCLKEAVTYKKRHGSLSGFNTYIKYVEPNQVLISQCDILVLTAIERSLLYHIVDKIQAKIVVEAANAAMPPTAHRILVGRKKLVLPDIYISCGSSIISYFEYLKNAQQLLLKPDTSCTNTILLEALKSGKYQIKSTLPNYPVESNLLRQKILLDDSERNAATEVIDDMMAQLAQDLMETAEKYNLGLDFRTAAYIKALKKLFWTAYKY